MTQEEIQLLAVYNTEKARGLVHTLSWVLEMGRLQSKFNHWHLRIARGFAHE